MWSLFENNQELKPLIFSNGKSQEDVVNEVVESIKQGNKIIFIRGMCGTGKSAIALNLAKELGRTSIVVPIKSLQQQYINDYSDKKYVLKDFEKMKNFEKLKIKSIVGIHNFKFKYLKESKNPIEIKQLQEKNAKLSDIFLGVSSKLKPSEDKSCNNIFLPCKIEIKEKNLPMLKDYIKQNPDIKITDFNSVLDIKRMTIAPICPYWSPILPEEFEIRKFKNARKIKYLGLDNRKFVFNQRKKGCGFYDQYLAYEDADVIIFNSMKYKLETLMNRKPATEIEIIDECDEFLDSFANKEKINLNRLLFSLNLLFPEDSIGQAIIDDLIDITNTIRLKKSYQEGEIFPIKDTLVEKLLIIILRNQEFLYGVEADENNYVFHLDEVAKTFQDFLDETFFSIEKRENDIIVHLVTTNLAKKLKELIEKNKVLIMMSGTIHSESVLRGIFGLEEFKIIDAETKHQGELIKCRHGYEIDCKYTNFQNNHISREQYLKALSKSIASAKLPILVHITAFSDLPTDYEKTQFELDNLPTRAELMHQQASDPLSKKVADFKQGKIPILFTTRCNRGADFPGETCNSIVITRFPYPNISAIFWKILKQNKPEHFMSFYIDKARRDLLQKIYRGLRSKDDEVYLLSPDTRVLDFKIN